jgi:hypothetical protein
VFDVRLADMRVTNWPNIFVDQGQFSDPDFISGTHKKKNVHFADKLIYLISVKPLSSPHGHVTCRIVITLHLSSSYNIVSYCCSFYCFRGPKSTNSQNV